jgi:hypothetical protein
VRVEGLGKLHLGFLIGDRKLILFHLQRFIGIFEFFNFSFSLEYTPVGIILWRTMGYGPSFSKIFICGAI